MTDLLTPRDLIEAMLDASAELDSAQADLETKTREQARSENGYRKARANAYLGTSGTVGEREAFVDKATGQERYAAHLSEGLAKAALEAVRSRRTQLSVLQTISSAVKEELAMARTGPEYGP